MAVMHISHVIDLVIGNPAFEIEVEYTWIDGKPAIVSALKHPHSRAPRPYQLDNVEREQVCRDIIESGGPG